LPFVKVERANLSEVNCFAAICLRIELKFKVNKIEIYTLSDSLSESEIQRVLRLSTIALALWVTRVAPADEPPRVAAMVYDFADPLELYSP
jgi:hypothetical protein